MKEIRIVSCEILHVTILKFIDSNKIIIGEYDDMKECIMSMIRAGYVFNMDRERLIIALTDLTYMLCPEDDMNKDRVNQTLEFEEDEYSNDSGSENSDDSDNLDDLDGSEKVDDKSSVMNQGVETSNDGIDIIEITE